MITIINVECIDQELIITNAPVIASGGKHENFIQFKFCSKWDDFSKIAVFYRNTKDVYHAVINDINMCEIPWEVTNAEGVMYFGVFGNHGGTQRTSKVLKYKISKGAITEDLKPSDPTPDIYEQLLTYFNAMVSQHDMFVREQEALMKEYHQTWTNTTEMFIDDQTKAQDAFEAEINAKCDSIIDGVRRTTDRTLAGSYAGGLKLNEIDGNTVQDGVPTIEEPQELKSVATGGILEIKASSKNLVDIPNGTYDVSASFDCNLEAGNYIFSREAFESTYASAWDPYAIIIYCEFEGETIPCGEYLQMADSNNISFEAFGPVVKFEILAGETLAKSAGHSFTITNAMIRKEGTDEVFVPCQGSNSIEIPLAQPLKQCDKIVKQDGVWGVLRATKTVPFGGKWQARPQFVPSDGSACYSSADFITDNMKSTEYMYMSCTHLTFGGGVVGGADISRIGKKGCFYKISVYVSTGGTTTYICSDAQTVEDFMAEMEGAVFEYELAEPIFEPFPVEVQIALHNLLSYESATYISTNSEVEPVIDIDYSGSRTGALTLENSNLIAINDILKSEYSNKTEVAQIISDALANHYSKEEVDAKISELNGKFNDYYPKDQIDALLKVINDALPYAITIDDTNKTIDFVDR